MNLAQLKKKGGVIADALVVRDIEWAHLDSEGKEVTDTFKVHIRRHTFGVMETMFTNGGDEQFRNARYVASSVMLGENGDEALPVEDAMNLDSSLGFLFLKAVNEVNSAVKS